MAVSLLNVNMAPNHSITGFRANRKDISYGYINLEKKENLPKATTKDKILAATGAIAGVSLATAGFMKHQKIKNPLKLKYSVPVMLSMAASGNAGGVLLSSIGEPPADRKKKWKEAAFQMVLTSAPMLLVDGAIKLCERTKKLNNNFAKIAASVIGVAIGSNSAIALSNKLRNDKEAKKPKRELKPIDMIANIDDAVAILVLAKIPFADKIHIERALPFIYSFCGYRSGTGDGRKY